MKPIVFSSVVALALALAAPCLAQSQDPSGTYLSETGDTRVRIARCGGVLRNDRGRPRRSQGRQQSRGDAQGPQPRRVQMLSNIRPSGDGFEGSLYNYKDGKTYTGKMSFASGNAMQLSGCVMGGLICRTQTWTKVN